MSKSYIVVLAIILISALIVFQNCSEVGFTSPESKANLTGLDGHGELGLDDGQGESTENEAAPEDGDNIIVVLPPDPTNDVIFECNEYVELSGDTLTLPERLHQVCYYVKLMSAVQGHKSGSLGEVRDKEVLASDHNGDTNEYIGPFILADKTFDLSGVKDWKMAVSGAFNNPDAPMAIDNFFLINVETTTSQGAWGFGTADAEPGKGAKPILENNEPIQKFSSFAQGGTAVVTAIDVTPSQSLLNQMLFRFRALDCGGKAESTDVYLVFH